MAWEAKLLAARKDPTVANRVIVDVTYYDTADPSATLHGKRFDFPVLTANLEMRAAIIAEGQKARATFDRAAQLAAAFPAGTTIAIP